MTLTLALALALALTLTLTLTLSRTSKAWAGSPASTSGERCSLHTPCMHPLQAPCIGIGPLHAPCIHPLHAPPFTSLLAPCMHLACTTLHAPPCTHLAPRTHTRCVRCGVAFAGHPAEEEEGGHLLTLHGRIGNIPASEVEVVVDAEALDCT
eukprot:scaffold4465_cov47-Phaeocystis_antarctica.AAC.5